MAEPVIQTLRRVHADVSKAHNDLDLLYRTHQSRRLAILPRDLARLSQIASSLSDLISELHSLPPAPIKRVLGEDDACSVTDHRSAAT